MNKIQQFIKDNGLDITDVEYGDSGGNSLACILSGYALYLGMTEEELIGEIGEIFEEDNSTWDSSEIERVFAYAKSKNYGDWWKKPEAHNMYKFDEIVPSK